MIASSEASHEDVKSAGLKLLALIYGGRTSDTLNHLRFLAYMNKTASCTSLLCPERLPPTENSAMYHLYRTHLQVIQWKTFMTTDLEPQQWGWTITDGVFEPIMMDLNAAPDELLSVVRCKCKIEGRRPCATQLCSCLKHGLSCVSACKNCNGEECENATKCTNIMECENSDLDEEENTNDLAPVLEDLVPEDGLQFDIPWLDEEEVWQVIVFIPGVLQLILQPCLNFPFK